MKIMTQEQRAASKNREETKVAKLREAVTEAIAVIDEHGYSAQFTKGAEAFDRTRDYLAEILKDTR
jgi:hypothetical protein